MDHIVCWNAFEMDILSAYSILVSRLIVQEHVFQTGYTARETLYC